MSAGHVHGSETQSDASNSSLVDQAQQLGLEERPASGTGNAPDQPAAERQHSKAASLRAGDKKTSEARNADIEQSLPGEGRWDDVLARKKLEAAAQAASSGEHNDARARWHRAFLYAKQISGPKMEQDGGPLGAGETASSQSHGHEGSQGDSIRRASSRDLIAIAKNAKERAYNRDPETGKRKPFGGANGQKAIKVKKKLEEQHWLELIDPKHRYGSNLKYYFEEWQSTQASGNFFQWLDYGPGKNLSLEQCPRDKLEKENILYLSVDQRMRYLVFVDPQDGKLRWKSPCEEAIKYCHEKQPLVDTTGYRWTDLGDGRGVAPAAALPEPRSGTANQAEAQSPSSSSSEDSQDFDEESGSDSASDASVEIPPEVRPGALRRTSSMSLSQPSEDEAEEEDSTSAQLTDAGGQSSTASGKDEENKKKKKKKAKKEKGDVWIYASDARYRIYLGIKQKGRFQHSSFLAGGPITSAGTLVIKDGVLIACNPMSGHYRTKAMYFKRFIEELEKQGADLSQVKVGKTELKLWFVERANTLHALKGKTRRFKKGVEKKLHMDDRHHQALPELPESPANDKKVKAGDSAEKSEK